MLNKEFLEQHKEKLFIGFSCLFFVLLANVADLYCLALDFRHWVPVNTPPMSIGDEYHYFSVQKMIAFWQFSDVSPIEYSRFVPYFINSPVYYIGSVLFDTRFGIYFVRMFNMGFLFFSLFYFLEVIRKLNGWTKNSYLTIFSIFAIFYGFKGVLSLFMANELVSLWKSISLNPFRYLGDYSYLYHMSSLNYLARGINASTTSPIMLLIFAFRLNHKSIHLMQYIVLLIILAFTCMPVAVAFGLISTFLDVYGKVPWRTVLINATVGGLVGIFILIMQRYYMFSNCEAAQEVIDMGFKLRFSMAYFSALFLALLISYFGRKNISKSVCGVFILLSFFHPLSYVLGSLHSTRLWLRSTVIIYLTLLIYLLIVLVFKGINILLKGRPHAIRAIIIIFVFGFCIVILNFSIRNAMYLAVHKERFVDDSKTLDLLLSNDTASIVVTNSPNISMLTEIYSINQKPLMRNFTLQSDGYKVNFARAIVNFELLGITQEQLLNKMRKHSTRYDWLLKRIDSTTRGSENYENYYFDQILYIGTCVIYNNKMIKDKVKDKKRNYLLEDAFFKIPFDKKSVYTQLEVKKVVYIIDPLMPFAPNYQTIKN